MPTLALGRRRAARNGCEWADCEGGSAGAIFSSAESFSSVTHERVVLRDAAVVAHANDLARVIVLMPRTHAAGFRALAGTCPRRAGTRRRTGREMPRATTETRKRLYSAKPSGSGEHHVGTAVIHSWTQEDGDPSGSPPCRRCDFVRLRGDTDGETRDLFCASLRLLGRMGSRLTRPLLARILAPAARYQRCGRAPERRRIAARCAWKPIAARGYSIERRTVRHRPHSTLQSRRRAPRFAQRGGIAERRAIAGIDR